MTLYHSRRVVTAVVVVVEVIAIDTPLIPSTDNFLLLLACVCAQADFCKQK